jgi:hypothetical protein
MNQAKAWRQDKQRCETAELVTQHKFVPQHACEDIVG